MRRSPPVHPKESVPPEETVSREDPAASTATEPRRPRIALMGSRGIPSNYGGYETLMEELAPRLCELGYDVTVYCRSHYVSRDLDEYKGVRLVVLPTIKTKHLDTPVHTFLSCLDAVRRRFDAALIVNSANAIFVPILRVGRIRTALHVDGLEQERSKWGGIGRAVYRWSERFAGYSCHRLVTDARTIESHYLERYGFESTMIPYGVDSAPVEGTDTLERLGLAPGRYFLYVSRFEPENNPHRVAAAYRDVKTDLPLVMVGDAPYSSRLIEAMKREADHRVLFPGAIYGDGYRQLQSGALAYIQATEVGGTHPALVEAMGYGNCVLVHRNPENLEVAGDSALYYDVHDAPSLIDLLQQIADDHELAKELGDRAETWARTRYSWERVTRQYDELFRSMLPQQTARHRARGLSAD